MALEPRFGTGRSHAENVPAGRRDSAHRFTGTDPDLQWPMGRLVEAADGKLYGIAQRAGAEYAGAAYRIRWMAVLNASIRGGLKPVELSKSP